MKYVAIFMVVLVIAAAGLGAYTYANARLQVVSVELKTAAGGERVQEFTALQTAVDRGALNGTAFTESVPGTAADYSFFTYTFRLRNGGLIDAEMVEIQPIPANGDVLAYATSDASPGKRQYHRIRRGRTRRVERGADQRAEPDRPPGIAQL